MQSVEEINRQIKKKINKKHEIPVFEEPLEAKDRYTLEDFLQYNGEEFFINAYHTILKRAPDSSIQGTLGMLRNGLVTKKEIVVNLRYSEEGKAHAVKIDHLPPIWMVWLNRLIHKRIVGYPLKMMKNLLLLPRSVQNFRALEERVALLEKELKKIKKTKSILSDEE